MTDKLVNYRGDDGIAILTLNDPPANTYTHEMMRDLDEAILEARFDDDVHVIVLRGAGREVLLRRRQHQHAQEVTTRTSSTTSACTPTRRSTASSRRPSW